MRAISSAQVRAKEEASSPKNLIVILDSRIRGGGSSLRCAEQGPLPYPVVFFRGKRV